MQAIADNAVSISGLNKRYASGFQALENLDLTIRKGEIFALLGPNGAGKTTLISIVCGIVTASSGSVTVAGHDIVRDYRITRSKIGLVPQELTTTAPSSRTVKFRCARSAKTEMGAGAQSPTHMAWPPRCQVDHSYLRPGRL